MLSSYSNLTPLDFVNRPRPYATHPGISTNHKHHTISTHHVYPLPSFHSPKSTAKSLMSPITTSTPTSFPRISSSPASNTKLHRSDCVGVCNERGTTTDSFPKELASGTLKREGPRHFLLHNCGRIAKPRRRNEHRQNDLGFEYHCPFVSACFRWAKDDRRERTEPPPETIHWPIAKRQEGTPSS